MTEFHHFLQQSEMWRIAAMTVYAGLYFVIFAIEDGVPLTYEQKKKEHRRKLFAARVLWVMWGLCATLQFIQHSDLAGIAQVGVGFMFVTLLFLRIAGPNRFATFDAT